MTARRPIAEIAQVAGLQEALAAAGSGLPFREYASVDRVTTTIQAAINAALARSPSSRNDDYHPSRRRLVLIPAGTYDEYIAELPGFIDLAGETGNPDDVIITSSSQTYATLAAAGGGKDGRGNTRLFGLTAEHVTNGAETYQYALHIDYASLTPVLFYAKDCKFRTIGTSVNGKSAIGLGVWDRQSFYFKDCEFYSSVSYKGAVFAHNGNGAAGKGPALLVFDGCTAECLTTEGVHFADSSVVSGQDDLFIWSGGSIKGVTNDLVAEKTTGTSLSLLLDEDAYKTASFGTLAQHYATPGGFVAPSPQENPTYDGFWIGDPKEKWVQAPAIPDAAPSTITPLRFYYWPFHIEKTRLVNLANVPIASAHGNVIFGIYGDRGTGAPNSTAAYLATVASTATGTGRKTLTPNLKRFLFPGRYWAAIAFDSATVEPVCSSYAPLVQKMYYEDLASLAPPVYPTPVELASGPVPIVTLEVV